MRGTRFGASNSPIPIARHRIPNMPPPDAQQFQKSPGLNRIALPGEASRDFASSLSRTLDAAKSALTGANARVAAGLLIVAISYYLAAKTSLSLRFSGST